MASERGTWNIRPDIGVDSFLLPGRHVQDVNSVCLEHPSYLDRALDIMPSIRNQSVADIRTESGLSGHAKRTASKTSSAASCPQSEPPHQSVHRFVKGEMKLDLRWQWAMCVLRIWSEWRWPAPVLLPRN